MADRVLVAYATRYGSTQEVAEEITGVLPSSGRRHGLERCYHVWKRADPDKGPARRLNQ